MRLIKFSLVLASMLVIHLMATCPVDAQENVETLATSEFPAAGCLRLVEASEAVIGNEETFLKMVRNDAGGRECLTKLPKVDFKSESLIGITLNTGYCRRPVSLQNAVSVDVEQKRYLVTITFLEPNGVCRALSRYDLWIRLPRLKDDFNVRFEVKPLTRDSR